MRLLLAALPFLLLLSGCFEADLGEPDEDKGNDGEPGEDGPGEDGGGPGSTSQSTRRETLGSATGTTVAPARYPFEVVADAGATQVTWSMVIEGPSTSLSGRVEGPGCALANGFSTSLGSASFGGECASLAPGTHEFVAVLDAPALSFDALVTGQVTRTAGGQR